MVFASRSESDHKRDLCYTKHTQHLFHHSIMHVLDSLYLSKKLLRHPAENKGNFGRVVVIGGAKTMSGSLVLAGLGALYTGAGWVKLIPLNPQFPEMIESHPELMVYHAYPKKPTEVLKVMQPDVIVIGPGLGIDALAYQWLLAAIAYHAPLVVDADALHLLTTHPSLCDLMTDRFETAILTPHPGEAGFLLHRSPDDIQHDRHAAAMHMMEMYQSIVILKGHKTLLAHPQEPILTCLQGNPGMACAGMGDVLSGAIGSLIAQGSSHHLSAWQACCLAVEIHARSGDLLAESGVGPIGMTPSELAKTMRTIFNQAMHAKELS